MRASAWVAVCLVFGGCGHGDPAWTQVPPIAARVIAARSIPVPSTVSPGLQALIARPAVAPQVPRSTQEWKSLIQWAAARDLEHIAALRKQFAVTVKAARLGGVSCYVITPTQLPAANRHRLLLNLHGGAYVFGPGVAGTLEAIVMAGFGKFKVISVDYRMPPDHPYPAAMDDALAVWKALLHVEKPGNMGIFGTSAGGGMTLALVQRIRDAHLALPAAIAPGTPWSDLTKTGDSYYTNESVDNVLVAYEPLLGAAARLYANGLDLKDPHLSPVYGDFHDFPPTLLTTGTRDLFLSNTVRVQHKLRLAGVEAELQVYEGQSHAQYLSDSTTPESQEAFDAIARFFERHLGQ